jgi:DNA-binding NarL/FixJ family response regulator
MEEQAKTISVFLIDTNVLFRHGAFLALSKYKDLEVVGEADITQDTLEIIEQFSPNVVLVDVNMPQFNGLDLTRQITQHCPQSSVVVLTPFEDENQLFQAIKSGAAAYVSKNVNADELANVIRKVAGGDHVITEVLLTKPRVAERVLKQFQDLSLAGMAMESLAAPITSREMEVLSYVARGYGNKQIAHTLNICEQTIKHHITSILRKLDANDRTHAVVLAIRHGWISVAGSNHAY